MNGLDTPTFRSCDGPDRSLSTLCLTHVSEQLANLKFGWAAILKYGKSVGTDFKDLHSGLSEAGVLLPSSLLAQSLAG